MRVKVREGMIKFLYFMFLIFLSLILLTNQNQTCDAYYSLSPYSSQYGLGLNSSGLGLYGNSAYGLGLYGGLSSLYGLGGIYGTTGLTGLSSLGGLYGLSSLYGLSGLGSMYGSPLLKNMFGLGNLGNLNALSSFRGAPIMPGLLYGLMGGLGMNNLYGLGGSGLNSMYGLGGLGYSNLLGLTGLYPSLTSTTPLSPNGIISAEQAGTWTGYWNSYVKLTGGPMNMTLIEDLTLALLGGEVNLLLNKFTNSLPAEVSGTYTGGTTFILTGDNQAAVVSSLLLLTTTGTLLYYIELNCTLTSNTTMTGTYLIRDPLKLSIDYGAFNLTLSSAVVI